MINIIKANITLLFILKYNTYIFKRLFNKSKDKKINFILFNIIIIKRFLINIVLKTFYYKKGL
jgi:hypothetical protein